jgi:predicted anti-sigma-YlaC factor YlaD
MYHKNQDNAPMINCDKTQSLLTEYLDGTLEPDLKKEIELHLEQDPQCNKIFAEAAALQRQMQNLTQVAPSTNFDINLRNRIIKYNEQPNKQPVINKKGLSLAFSGTILMAALYMFIFTDVGEQPNVNEGILPSSTIGSGVPVSKIKSSVDNTNKEKIVDKNQADSLKRAPEVINDSNLHLTGEEQKQ